MAGRRLYLCTPNRPDLEAFVAACIAGGVDVVQLREKSLGDSALVERARQVRRVCVAEGVPFILNDRPDLVETTGADGVHVGQDDMAPRLARELIGPDAILGLSTHDRGQLSAALGEPVDYISVGPIVPTPTKPGRPGTGLGYVTEAAQACAGGEVELPFFVTGDARPETVDAMAMAGARRFVVVRALTQAVDPRAAAAALCQAITRALEQSARGL